MSTNKQKSKYHYCFFVSYQQYIIQNRTIWDKLASMQQNHWYIKIQGCVRCILVWFRVKTAPHVRFQIYGNCKLRREGSKLRYAVQCSVGGVTPKILTQSTPRFFIKHESLHSVYNRIANRYKQLLKESNKNLV